MRATELKKKYPEIWNDVHDSMIRNLRITMSGADVEELNKENKNCRILVIAHNAAFCACYAIHKYKKA